MPPVKIEIMGKNIVTTDSLKYLGIILDRRLNFKLHFLYIEQKANSMMHLLTRLMPNTRGPKANKRSLYVNVHAVMLYSAPIWSDAFGMFQRQQLPLLRIQRKMALCSVMTYRTVSFEASMLLAKIPPLFLLAAKYKRIYERKKILEEYGEDASLSLKEIYEMANTLLLRQWKAMLQNPCLPGPRVREAILPYSMDGY